MTAEVAMLHEAARRLIRAEEEDLRDSQRHFTVVEALKRVLTVDLQYMSGEQFEQAIAKIAEEQVRRELAQEGAEEA